MSNKNPNKRQKKEQNNRRRTFWCCSPITKVAAEKISTIEKIKVGVKI